MTTADAAGSPSVAAALRGVVAGADDTRLRATWRLLLAYPVLWLLPGGVLAGNLQARVSLLPGGGDPLGGLTQSVLHAGFLVLVLAGWARYVDREPLTSYGVSATPRWARHLCVGYAALLVGQAAWLGVGGLVGGVTVSLALAGLGAATLAGVAVTVLALLLHAAVQQVVFFRVIGTAAAEGLHARGLSARRAVLGALPVAVLLFVAMHQLSDGLRVLDLAVVGAAFGLLYLQTGEVALGTGVHLGALSAGSLVFVPAASAGTGPAVLAVAGSLPGVLGVASQVGFPRVVLAYLLVLGWLRWRGEADLEAGIASPGA